MAPDRLGSDRLRWLAVAVLAALPLAQVWSYQAGYPGGTTLINQFNPYTGGLDLVPYYLPGTPGTLVLGFQSPARLALVATAALALLLALGGPSRRLERAALAALIAAAVLALGAHSGHVLLPLLLALALVGRPVRDAAMRILRPAPAPR